MTENTLTLRSQIMAEIGFGFSPRELHGSVTCREIRRRAAALLPITMQKHHAAGALIALPWHPLMELVHWVANNELDSFSVWKSWDLTHDVIGAHINSARKLSEDDADAATSILHGVYADLLARYVPKSYAERVSMKLDPLPDGLEDKARDILKEVAFRLKDGTLRSEIGCLHSWDNGRQDGLVCKALIASLLAGIDAAENNRSSVDEMFRMAMIQVEIAYRVDMIDRALRNRVQEIFAGTKAEDMLPDVFGIVFSHGMVTMEEEAS